MSCGNRVQQPPALLNNRYVNYGILFLSSAFYPCVVDAANVIRMTLNRPFTAFTEQNSRDFYRGHDPTRRHLTGRVGSGQVVFEISRVGTGRVRSVGLNISRFGSGRPGPTRHVRSGPVREKPRKKSYVT